MCTYCILLSEKGTDERNFRGKNSQIAVFLLFFLFYFVLFLFVCLFCLFLFLFLLLFLKKRKKKKKIAKDFRLQAARPSKSDISWIVALFSILQGRDIAVM